MSTAFNPGDRVVYAGKCSCYWGRTLHIHKTPDNGRTWSCKFEDPGRPPENYGLTTWLESADLILDEAAS
jgi:photosystem II stability/assembly factor-like uncharacterized protein